MKSKYTCSIRVKFSLNGATQNKTQINQSAENNEVQIVKIITAMANLKRGCRIMGR